MIALEVKDLNKKYPDFHLKDVSFQLEKGYIMALLVPMVQEKQPLLNRS